MPKNINYTISITVEGIEKIKTKNDDKKEKEFEEYFTNAARKRQQTLKWLLDFVWPFIN